MYFQLLPKGSQEGPFLLEGIGQPRSPEVVEDRKPLRWLGFFYECFDDTNAEKEKKYMRPLALITHNALTRETG